jgi:hypothetical protein
MPDSGPSVCICVHLRRVLLALPPAGLLLPGKGTGSPDTGPLLVQGVLSADTRHAGGGRRRDLGDSGRGRRINRIVRLAGPPARETMPVGLKMSRMSWMGSNMLALARMKKSGSVTDDRKLCKGFYGAVLPVGDRSGPRRPLPTRRASKQPRMHQPEIDRALARRPGHESVRTLVAEILCHAFRAAYLDLDPEVRLPEVHGRVDTLFGATVFEFKRGLRRELPDVQARLPGYLRERERQTGRRRVVLAKSVFKSKRPERSGGKPARDGRSLAWSIIPNPMPRERLCLSRSPGYFHKEMSVCYNCSTVQPGMAMTVKEMRPAGFVSRQLTDGRSRLAR